MRRKTIAFSITLFAILALAVTVVFGADIYSGTWKLNVAKSTYSPGPAPAPPKEPNTQKITAVRNGFKVVQDGINSKGQKTHGEDTVLFNGKDYPIKFTIDGILDPHAADTISANKIDDYTIEFTSKLKGKVLGHTKFVISKDGRTETLTATGTNAQGQAFTNINVYEKQ